MDNTISVETLRRWLEEGQPVRVLDIRPDVERAEWAIPGSTHRDLYSALQAQAPNLFEDVEIPGEGPIVTVCAAGRTSLLAAEQLQAHGESAFSLEGGMKAWSLAWNRATIALPTSHAVVLQLRRTGKGCLSYLIGSAGVAAVIDPALPSEVYLALAEEQDLHITHVLDTHIHADHLSRARQLVEQSGATLYLPAQKRATFDFEPLQDGNVLRIGEAELKVLATPGHTLESASYLLDEQALFTGDTLFLAGVGRPDLEASTTEAQQRASHLYHSLQRIFALDPATLILPGHTSEPVPFDGVPVAAPLSELDGQRTLLERGESEFVAYLLERIPPTPPNHERIVSLNEAGQMPAADPMELEGGANRCAIQ